MPTYNWKALQRPKTVTIGTPAITITGITSITPALEAEVNYEKRGDKLQSWAWVGGYTDSIEIVTTDFTHYASLKPGMVVCTVTATIGSAQAGHCSSGGSVSPIGGDWVWSCTGNCVVESSTISNDINSISTWTIKLTAVLAPDGTESTVTAAFTA